MDAAESGNDITMPAWARVLSWSVGARSAGQAEHTRNAKHGRADHAAAVLLGTPGGWAPGHVRRNDGARAREVSRCWRKGLGSKRPRAWEPNTSRGRGRAGPCPRAWNTGQLRAPDGEAFAAPE
eukprot:10824988-Alexandrium_andersonii.AAC.1